MSKIGRWRRAGAVCAIALMASSNVRAIDQEQAPREPSTSEVLADAVVARPLSAVGAVLGTLVFIVSLPFTIPSGTADRAGNALVKKPLQETFKRPIGQFDSCETLPESCK